MHSYCDFTIDYRDVREMELVASVTVRNLPDEVRERLRQRAARAGRSMEAEIRVRSLLTQVWRKTAKPRVRGCVNGSNGSTTDESQAG